MADLGIAPDEPQEDEAPEAEEKFEGRGIEAYKRMFSRAEEACIEARKLAHRDRDWHDNFNDNQWDDDEKTILKKRRQPIVTSNRIKRKIGFLCGLEQRQRSDPKAYPRNPQDAETATVVTDVLDFVETETRFDNTASQAFKDLNIEGIEAAEVIIENGDVVAINMLQYDGFFYDPRSKKRDFLDARYLGYQDWFDEDEAFDMFRTRAENPEMQKEQDDKLRNLLSGSYEDGAQDEGYEDKPFAFWGDEDRKRVRVACMYWKGEGGTWNYTYFTGGGVLKEGVSPYLDDKGKPDCAIIAASAYMTRKNERFGSVRDMISPQSEMNFRRSQALFYMKQKRLWQTNKGILPADASEQMNRADGIVTANGPKDQAWGFIENQAEVANNFELLQEAKAEIAVQGPNAGLQGRGTEDQSGKAIALQQNAGMAEENDIFDTHNDWKLRIYRAMWCRVKQFWTEPKFIRITDDENSFKFIHLNQQQPVIDPATGQPQIGPDGQPVMQMVPGTELAKMDADIILQAAPDSITLQHEEFLQLTEMAKSGVPIPPDVLLEASQIRDKQKLAQRMKEEMGSQAKLQQAAQQIEQMGQVIEQMKKQLEQAGGADKQLEMAKLQMEAQKEQGNAQLKAAEMEIKKAELALKGEEINLKRGELSIKGKESQLKEADLALRQTELMTTTQLQRDQMAMAERQAAAQAMQAKQTQQPTAERPDRTSDALGKGLEALAAAMTKPKSIVRGPDGRAIGVE